MFLWRNKNLIYPCPADPSYTAFANCVDPDQLASEEALFAIKHVNLYQQPGSSNLKISGCGILIYSAGQELIAFGWKKCPIWSYDLHLIIP